MQTVHFYSECIEALLTKNPKIYSLSKPQGPDIRNATWGMTCKQVVESETFIFGGGDEGRIIFFEGNLYDVRAVLEYVFIHDSLFKLSFDSGLESNYSGNKANHLNTVRDYISVQKGLKKEYGEPFVGTVTQCLFEHEFDENSKNGVECCSGWHISDRLVVLSCLRVSRELRGDQKLSHWNVTFAASAKHLLIPTD